MKYKLLAALLVALAFAATAVYRVQQFLNVPPETPGHEVTIVIEPGQSFEQTARTLRQAGLIADEFKFRLLALYTGLGSRIRAGEFLLNTGLVPAKILDILANTPGVLHRLSVPEGLTLRQTAKLVEEAGLGSAVSFESAAADAQLLAKYDIAAKTAEGFLFPQTYMLTRKPGGDTRYVVEAMLAEFRKQAKAIWPDAAPAGKALVETVILASIVEKESALPSERPKVAGVFKNRLAKGMLLQTDPTVIYGLGEAYDGSLHRAQLDDPANPYNTYKRPGLPPGPICSPGRESLAAASNPEKHALYYFVSRKDGSHYFSATLDEHNDAVRRFQLNKQGRANAQDRKRDNQPQAD
ncbi:MAG: endolytic transglycosylase MltG [Desulfovibrionaceae bacterium]|nr:endolytic transglycosylase MltG [Desulfovibrionaceae bacterium]MBF0513135.1 endolytic transglycosylase MltG [Desulfovibrionaceae bacterium]